MLIVYLKGVQEAVIWRMGEPFPDFDINLVEYMTLDGSEAKEIVGRNYPCGYGHEKAINALFDWRVKRKGNK